MRAVQETPRVRPAAVLIRPVWILVVLCSAALLSAQNSRPQTKPDPAPRKQEKQAFRLVKNFELPAKRADAIERLVRIGKPAVRPLTLTLNDPRPEIVICALRTLAAMGEDAESVLPVLARMAKGNGNGNDTDAVLAHAAAWARSGIRKRGVFLIVKRKDKQVVEMRVDAKGQATEKPVLKNLQRPWDAELLPNGNYLVTEHTPSGVLEVDATGKEVWSYKKVKHPMDADRLPNGNTLIADTQNDRVLEVDAKGDVVWKFDKGVRPNDADRLPNGNTLIANARGKRVLEVNKAGKVVWQLKDLGTIVDADRLLNGNTLVACFSKRVVRELDPKGKVVFEVDVAASPRDADRLANGDTVVATDQAVLCFDKAGKKLWEVKGTASEIVGY